MGFMGVLMLIIVQAALADHTGENRGIAISESTIGASVAGLMGPLLISQLAATTLGWRAALVLASLSWVLMFVFGRKITIPASPHKDGHHRSRRRLPGMYWLFWGVMLLGTAVEWSVAFWSPEYFEQVIGVERTTAAGTLTFFWLAFIVGRLGGSVLSRRFQPSTLLVGAAVLVLVAFPFLLLVRDPIVALGALFVMALGISNFFPMTLASALHAGRDNVDTASARVAIANGLAILIAPQVLGSLGDQVGIGSAYAMIGVLGAGVLALGYVARRVERREERRALLAS
ncbi:MAG: MFS transporter [Anaerolineae bacterium]|nr:MFS transporter [Anaerolineae bacterium]